MDYFLAKPGQKPVGPLSREQVREMLDIRAFLLSDLVWTAAQKDWVKISERMEFYHQRTPASSTTIKPRLGYVPAPATRTVAPPTPVARFYEAFLGAAAPRYVPAFERMDAGASPASWNWPAAFCSLPWMVWRGMFSWGLLWYPAFSFLVTMAVLIPATMLERSLGLTLALPVALVMLGAASVLVMGIYGTQILHAHVRRKMDRSAKLGLSEGDRLRWLAEAGKPRTTALVALIVPALLLAAAGWFFGWPAYCDVQDQARIGEALRRATLLQSAYGDFLKDKRRWPRALDDLGAAAVAFAATDAPAIASLGGRHELRLSFKPADTSRIGGRSLRLEPVVQGDRLSWVCRVDDLPEHLAPPSCRP